jgi:hypothetical protein
MVDIFDPRDETRDRDRDDDGIRDREDHWLEIGREVDATRDGEDSAGRDDRDPDADRYGLEQRERDPDKRHDDRCGNDPRDVFTRDLELPRGEERELVHDRDRDYSLRGSETRTLSTVGAFRIVDERDLRDPRDDDRRADKDVRHLRDQGLVERVSLDGRDHGVALTERGRDFLERHRSDRGRGRDSDRRQAFHKGTDKPRERSHDAQIYRAYLEASERLQELGATIVRVELDRDLKAEYQRFLQERNRGDRESDGRPDRTPEEIERWADDHDLPYSDDQVHFPDLRIEYRDRDDELLHEDIEVMTEHYRGGHAAAASQSGFTIFRSSNSKGGGSAFDPRVAEDFL